MDTLTFTNAKNICHSTDHSYNFLRYPSCVKLASAIVTTAGMGEGRGENVRPGDGRL